MHLPTCKQHHFHFTVFSKNLLWLKSLWLSFNLSKTKEMLQKVGKQIHQFLVCKASFQREITQWFLGNFCYLNGSCEKRWTLLSSDLRTMLHFVQVVHHDQCICGQVWQLQHLSEGHDTSPEDPCKELDTAWKYCLISYPREFNRFLNWIGKSAPGRCTENGVLITTAVNYSKLVSRVCVAVSTILSGQHHL